MKFIPVRELRARSAQVWKRLSDEKDMVVTSHGKPIAILSAVGEDDFEERIDTLRRARAVAAVREIQRRSVEKGTDKLTLEEINAEINKTRRERKLR